MCEWLAQDATGPGSCRRQTGQHVAAAVPCSATSFGAPTVQSKASTVQQYLAELPSDRAKTIRALRTVIKKQLDPLLEERMQYGMISYCVPHKVFPAGYHCDPKQPLPYACLASQKNHLSLYLMSAYADGTKGEEWFRKAWARTGKKLDMGKSCIRFKTIDDLALDVLAESFRRVSVADHLAWYAAVDPRNKPKSAKATNGR